MSIRFSYAVGSRRYSTCRLTPTRFISAPIGEDVPVIYLPERPDVAMVGDARDAKAALDNEVDTIGIGMILMPSFLCAVLFFRYGLR